MRLFATLCFHTYLRMHLHFLKNRSQEAESGVRISILRNLMRAPFPRAAGPAFSPVLCFHTYLRMHLHFRRAGVRRQEPEVSIRTLAVIALGLRTSNIGHRTASFVFIHIPAWNVISRNERVPPLFGLRTRTPDCFFLTHSGLERLKSLSGAGPASFSNCRLPSTGTDSCFRPALPFARIFVRRTNFVPRPSRPCSGTGRRSCEKIGRKQKQFTQRRKDAKPAKKTRRLSLRVFAPSRLCVRLFIFSHVRMPGVRVWLRLCRAVKHPPVCLRVADTEYLPLLPEPHLPSTSLCT